MLKYILKNGAIAVTVLALSVTGAVSASADGNGNRPDAAGWALVGTEESVNKSLSGLLKDIETIIANTPVDLSFENLVFATQDNYYSLSYSDQEYIQGYIPDVETVLSDAAKSVYISKNLAQDVADKIHEIDILPVPTDFIKYKSLIEETKILYDNLTENEKIYLVEVLGSDVRILTDAVKGLSNMESDVRIARNAISLVISLPIPIKLSDGPVIRAAESEYNSLTDLEKNHITVAEKTVLFETIKALDNLEKEKGLPIGSLGEYNGLEYLVVSDEEVSCQGFSGDAFSSVTIPKTVTLNKKVYVVSQIGGTAFSGNKTITKVVVAKGIKNIGNYAFSSCTGLNSLTIGSSVTYIGRGAFKNCTALTKVTLPTYLKYLGKFAFYKCKHLTYIKIKTSKLTMNNVGAGAFKGVPATAKVNVPNKMINSYTVILRKRGLNQNCIIY